MGVAKIAAYRDDTGGTVLTTGQQVPTFTDTVREDADVFQLDGASKVVVVQEARLVWARFGSRYDLTSGSGHRCIRTFLQTRPSGGSWSNHLAGYSYAHIMDLQGVTEAGSYCGVLLDMPADGEIRLGQRLEVTSSGTTEELADATYLELLALPAEFPVAIIELGNTVDNMGTSWTTVTSDWDSVRVDSPEFTWTDASGTLTCEDTGPHVIVGNFVFQRDSVSVSQTDEMSVWVRLYKNGTSPVPGSMRQVFIPDDPNEDDTLASITMEFPFDNTAGDDYQIQVRVNGGASGVDASIHARSGWAIFKDTSAPADRYRGEFRSTDQDANAATHDFELTTDVEKDASFTHSTTVDPEELTLAADGEYWLGAAMDMRRNAAEGTDLIAHLGRWFTGSGASPTAIDNRGQGWNLNRGKTSDGHEPDSSSLVSGIFREVGGTAEVIRYRATKEGTGSDANAVWESQNAGGGNALGPQLWAIRIDQWPEEQAITPDVPTFALAALEATVDHALDVTPDVAAMALAALEAAVAHALEVTPDAATMALASLEVTVDHALTITPDTGTMALASLEVTVDHALDVTPDVATFAFGAHEATVVITLGGQAITPDVATLTFGALEATASHALEVTPDVATLLIEGKDPALSLALVVTPDVAALILAGHECIVTFDAGAPTGPVTACFRLRLDTAADLELRLDDAAQHRLRADAAADLELQLDTAAKVRLRTDTDPSSRQPMK